MAKYNSDGTAPYSIVGIVTTQALETAVKALAQAEGSSVAAIGRKALVAYLERRTGPLGPEGAQMARTPSLGRPTAEEQRWRMISDLLDQDPALSKAKLQRLSDADLRERWYTHRDRERQRVEAEEERAHREAAGKEAGGT